MHLFVQSQHKIKMLLTEKLSPQACYEQPHRRQFFYLILSIL